MKRQEFLFFVHKGYINLSFDCVLPFPNYEQKGGAKPDIQFKSTVHTNLKHLIPKGDVEDERN
jgi:hypothetical protein